MIGTRLERARGRRNQGEMADALGVHKNTYARWERGQREIGAEALAALAAEGWNINWLLTGAGPERLDSLRQASGHDSQGLRQPDLIMAVQLAQEALDGDTLAPPDYAQLVALIYDALVHGLPSAQVIALARPAARGLNRESTRDEKSAVGGPGAGASGQG